MCCPPAANFDRQSRGRRFATTLFGRNFSYAQLASTYLVHTYILRTLPMPLVLLDSAGEPL